MHRPSGSGIQNAYDRIHKTKQLTHQTHTKIGGEAILPLSLAPLNDDVVGPRISEIVHMVVDHANARGVLCGSGTANEGHACPLNIDVELVDSGGEGNIATREVLRLLRRKSLNIIERHYPWSTHIRSRGH